MLILTQFKRNMKYESINQNKHVRNSTTNFPKAQQTQGNEFFDFFSSFDSKQKLQQALKSWSNFSLALFGKGRDIH